MCVPIKHFQPKSFKYFAKAHKITLKVCPKLLKQLNNDYRKIINKIRFFT